VSELLVKPSGPLRGKIGVQGDKSMSHRAVIMSSIAEGDTQIEGLLFGEDVRATMSAFQTMGVSMEEDEQAERLAVRGKGTSPLSGHQGDIYLGNSGTSMRLLSGLFSGLTTEVVLGGDESLNRRPMKRIIDPLRMMGADIRGTEKHTAPLSIRGGGLSAIEYEMPKASAQVKSSVLLAGLNASGTTRVKEPGPTRDHTELMFPAFGVKVKKDGPWSSIEGGQKLEGAGKIVVPGDFSSAAFFIVAALIVPDSGVTINGVGLNPTRTGLLDILLEMGAKISIENKRMLGKEPVGDIVTEQSCLKGVDIRGELVPRAIDEFPVLCVAAAAAEGKTSIREAAELRVKESDRISSMATVLKSMGVKVEEYDDGIDIYGGSEIKGASVRAELDHRVAMSATVAGLVASGETVVEGAETIGTSFPGFFARLTELSR